MTHGQTCCKRQLGLINHAATSVSITKHGNAQVFTKHADEDITCR